MTDTAIFDFDNHYYESTDAFTRHQDRALRNRGVRWADIDGKRRLIVRDGPATTAAAGLRHSERTLQ